MLWDSPCFALNWEVAFCDSDLGTIFLTIIQPTSFVKPKVDHGSTMGARAWALIAPICLLGS